MPARSLEEGRRCAVEISAKDVGGAAVRRARQKQQELFRSGFGADGEGWARARGAGEPRRIVEGRRRRRGGGQAARGTISVALFSPQLVVMVTMVLALCVQQGPSNFSLILPGVNGELRQQSELSSNCFDFPERNFDRANSIMAVNGGNTPYLPLETGSDAVDFNLHDLAGDRWSLRETLERTGLPVVMVFGMLTCPGFQGYGTYPPWDKCAYWDEYELVETYKERATFVHLYGPEPHPTMPGTNFDKGVAWQHYWSVVPQHQNYEERVATAERISDQIHPDEKILVDYMPGNPYSELIQPVWCTYAMGARAVTVITPDGELFFQRGWFHSMHVARAIEEYWCQQDTEEEEEEEEHLQQQQQGQHHPQDKPYQQGQHIEQQGRDENERGSSGDNNGGVKGGSSSGCLLPSGGGDSDMGDPGTPPLAGVLSKSGASLPPWLTEEN